MGDYCCGRTRRLGLTPGRAGQPATGLTYQPYSYSGGAVPLASADAAAYYTGYTAAKVRGFSPIASGFTAETDWLLEGSGFELPVPP